MLPCVHRIELSGVDRITGDSRAVVGAMKGSKILALDLSQDQCCANVSERERIKAAGGQPALLGLVY